MVFSAVTAVDPSGANAAFCVNAAPSPKPDRHTPSGGSTPTDPPPRSTITCGSHDAADPRRWTTTSTGSARIALTTASCHAGPAGPPSVTRTRSRVALDIGAVEYPSVAD